jgi:hypothetical protein
MERKPRKKYSREFKLEAVRLAAVDDRPKAQLMDEYRVTGVIAGAVLPAGWIDEARTPVWPASDRGSGYGWFWWVRQDGGYEAVGAYGQSVTIYSKDDVVIAINAASRDPPDCGLARWRLLQALDAAAVGRSDLNDTTK